MKELSQLLWDINCKLKMNVRSAWYQYCMTLYYDGEVRIPHSYFSKHLFIT